MTALKLKPEPLTQSAFAPFGDVIELPGVDSYPINKGFTMRHHDLAHVDVATDGGNPLVSIFRFQPRSMPLRLDLMERHPLGSQAFYPLNDREWLVVVGEASDPLDIANLRAFKARGTQGLNYARNVWHHPLLVLAADSDFLVVDRGGPGENLEEREFQQAIFLT